MATISTVAICNMALDHIGAKATVESLDEASAEAKACKRWYDWSRRQVLESHNWNFARRRQALALLETDPYDDWGYRYAYPSDCVKAREIVNPAGTDADAVPFTIATSEDGQTTTILTNIEDAVLEYTSDATDPTRFSSLFIDALAWRIGSRIAFTLTGKRELADDCMKAYSMHMRSASGHNADEGINRPPRDAWCILARE